MARRSQLCLGCGLVVGVMWSILTPQKLTQVYLVWATSVFDSQLPKICKTGVLPKVHIFYWVLSFHIFLYPYEGKRFRSPIRCTLYSPVLKIKDRGDHGRRTKDILGGPKSLETKKLGSSKGWGDQSAEKTNNWRVKKYLTKRWGTRNYALMLLVEFVVIYALFERTKRTKNLRWEDQNGF